MISSPGIRHNSALFAHLVVQVLLVGFAIGMTRTVVPALAESEFGVARGSFVLLSAFVVSFGAVKAVMNFVAGRWSERVGRRRVLLWGWVTGLPIPVMIWAAPDWAWIVIATVLLGVQQGLCWSMTQTAKLDITRPDERGLTMGVNEFAGYVGVALAGVLTAYVAVALGARTGLLVFGLAVMGTGLVLTWAFVVETLPDQSPVQRGNSPIPIPSTAEVFLRVSWQDRRLAALSQAGLVEKFVDALVWVVLPVYLVAKGVSLTQMGWIVGIYGFVWGGAQLFTGRLSDLVGRFWPNVLGMWVCGAGVWMMVLGEGAVWWSLWAGVTGFGMALLYPNLGASVADLSSPQWRGSAIGIYRFWRDLGYAIGALGLGLVVQLAGSLDVAFVFVAVSMLLSGAVLWVWGEETHPGLRSGNGP
jgi:MFS family permease